MAKCSILIGPTDQTRRVEIPESKVGLVQTFMQRTGYRFRDVNELDMFLVAGVIPRDAQSVLNQRAGITLKPGKQTMDFLLKNIVPKEVLPSSGSVVPTTRPMAFA